MSIEEGADIMVQVQGISDILEHEEGIMSTVPGLAEESAIDFG